MASIHIDLPAPSLPSTSALVSFLPLGSHGHVPGQSQGAKTFDDLDRDFDSEMALAYDVSNVFRLHTSNSSLTPVRVARLTAHTSARDGPKKDLIT